MRCGRAVCPPGPEEGDVDLVAGGGDRADAQRRLRRSPGAGRSAARRSARRRRARRPPIAASAPPGTVSSAGWKISRTRPGSSRRASSAAAPSRIAVCASWPQPWQQPVDRRAVADVLLVVRSAARRCRRAARSAGRRLPRSHTTPVPAGSTCGSKAERLQRVDDQLRSCASRRRRARGARAARGAARRRRSAHGASRSQRPGTRPSRRNRSRSCSRSGRPCQNSTASGASRKPPQCGGHGIVAVAEAVPRRRARPARARPARRSPSTAARPTRRAASRAAGCGSRPRSPPRDTRAHRCR